MAFAKPSWETDTSSKSNINLPSWEMDNTKSVEYQNKQVQLQQQQLQDNLSQVSKVPVQKRLESVFGPAKFSDPKPTPITQNLMNKIGKPTIKQGIKDYTKAQENYARPYEKVYDRNDSTDNKITLGNKIEGFLGSAEIPSSIKPKTIYQYKNDNTGEMTDPVKHVAVAESKSYYYTRLSDGSLVSIKKNIASEKLPSKQEWSKEKVKLGSSPVKEPNALMKFGGRVSDRLYEATGGVSSDTDLGFPLANFAADTIGTIGSFAQPSGAGTSFGNIGNQIGKNVVAKLESKGLQKVGGKVVNNALRGGIEGATSIAPVSFGQAQFQGLNAADTAKKVGLESLFAFGLGTGLGTIGGIIKKVKDGKPLTMQEKIAIQKALEPKDPVKLPAGIKETYTPQQRPLPKPFQKVQDGKPEFIPKSKFGNLNKMIDNAQNPQPVAPKQGAKILPEIKLGEATWGNKSGDQPIKVVGDLGEINGRRYVKIEGSNTGVPLDEVKYTPKGPQSASKETLQRIANNPTQYPPDMVERARAALGKAGEAQPPKIKKTYALKEPLQKGISKFGQTVKNSERISPELKSTIPDTPYEIKHNDATWKAATERVNKNPDKAMTDILTKADSSSADDVATGMALIDKYNAEGKFDEVNRILDKVTTDLTEHGQAIQAASMWKRQTPQGMLKYAYKQWENAASKIETPKHTEIKAELKAVQSKIDSLNARKAKVESRIKAEGKTAALAKELDDIDGMIEVNLQLFAGKQKLLPKVIRDLQPTPEDTKFILEHMEKFKNATEDRVSKIEFAKVMQRIADRLPATSKEKFKGLQRISLLSGIKSLVVKNPLSNVILGTAENIKDIPTTLLDKVMSFKTGNRTTLLPKYGILKEGQVSGLGKGVKGWASDVKNKIDTSPARGMMELPNKRIFKNTTETRFKAVNKVLDAKSDILNFVDQVERRMLQLGDRPFYESWKNSRMIELNKLNKTNKTKLTATEIEEQSKLYALDKVFQNNSDLAQRVKKIRDGFGIVGDIVMPFTQTPANVLDKLIDYSPGGFAKGIYHLGTTAGKGTFNQKLFADRIGRALTGTGIGILGYVMAKKGIITGKPNSDKDVADMEKNAGKSPYAIKIGNTYHTYDWAQPMSGMLAMGADAYYSGKDKKDFLSSAMAGVEGAGNTLVKQSMFQGLTSMFSGYSPVIGFGKTLLGAPLQAAPTGGKQISQLIDPYVRETYDPNPFKQAKNKFVAKIPFATKTLPIKQDTLGNDVKAYQGKNNVWNVMLNPGFTTKYDPTPVQEEILRLYDATGIKDQFPRVAPKSFEYQNPLTKTKDKIQLTSEEYVNYQKYLGTITNNAFNKIISTEEYKALPDDSKISTDLTKTKWLAEILTEANQIARVKVLIDRGIIKLPKKE